jgi:hypothetical protein
MTEQGFRELLNRLAEGWAKRDYAGIMNAYAPEVRYADPTRYRFNNREELRAFFEDDQGLDQRTDWRTVIFDEARQLAAVEYTYQGTHRYHGVALVRLENDQITHWREYQHTDPRDHAEFLSGTAFPV